MKPDEALLRDFLEFSRLQLASRDIDPVYPVIANLQHGMGAEEATAHTLTYVMFYNIASAEYWWWHGQHTVGEARLAAARAPTGTERRALRGGHNLLRHLADMERLRDLHGGYRQWLTRGFTGHPEEDWKAVQLNAQECWGNGRWASYKIAEMAMRINVLPVLPSDMGNEGSTGPRKGLEKLFGPVGGPGAVQLLDAYGADLLGRMLAAGLAVDLAEVETCVCDFHSLSRGHYYVGHDTDHMLEQITRHPMLPESDRQRLLAARAATLPEQYLGERVWWSGWGGVDKGRVKVYAQTGQVLCR